MRNLRYYVHVASEFSGNIILGAVFATVALGFIYAIARIIHTNLPVMY